MNLIKTVIMLAMIQLVIGMTIEINDGAQSLSSARQQVYDLEREVQATNNNDDGGLWSKVTQGPSGESTIGGLVSMTGVVIKMFMKSFIPVFLYMDGSNVIDNVFIILLSVYQLFIMIMGSFALFSWIRGYGL